jgi:diguanylate cyclase (GGDEF)-like protein
MNDELISKLRNCTNLPSLPAIAVQVLELAQCPQIDIQEIARVISKDPALTTKILRVVNSSFYGRSQAVSTVNQALVILGIQSVKTLVLGFSLATDMAKRKGKGFNHLLYWKRSICSATAAKTIAAKTNLVQQDEAFLVALLMDIGVLVLDAVLGDQYGEICAKSPTHNHRLEVEQETLGMNHADVAGILAQQWKLPPVLAIPITFSHNSQAVTDPALKRLTELVELAGLCGDVFVNDDASDAINAVRQSCARLYNMTEADTDALLVDVGAHTKEMAGLFEINIGSHKGYEEILQKAQERLLELTLQAQRQTTELQAQNEQLSRRAVELQAKATTDGLTGLANRATFDEALREQFAHITPGRPLTLLMMDLDRFKSVNDKHGHPAGDAVLKAVSAIIKKSAMRKDDLAARYGGEEMSLILPATPRAAGEQIADAIRRAVAATTVQCDRLALKVTISIGLATADAGGPLTSHVMLLKAADKAVYAAKHGGRNCVKVFALPNAAAA